MKVRKGILIGLVAALLAGATEAVAEGGLNALQDDRSREPSIMVPFAKIGDRALYQIDAPATDPTKDGYGSLTPSSYGIQVDSLIRQADRTGALHEGVVVLTDSWRNAYEHGILNREGSHTYNQSDGVVLDIETHELLGTLWSYQYNQQYRFLQQTQDAATGIQYGPDYGYGAPTGVFGPTHHVGHQSFLSQGRSYRLGENIDAEAVEYLAAETIFYAGDWGPQYAWGVTALDGSVTGRIAQTGTVNGLAAVDERFEGCASFEVTPDAAFLVDPPRLVFLGAEIPMPSRVCFTVDRWVSPERPFPLLEDRHLVINDTKTLDVRATLVAFEAGDGPIAWGPGPSAENYRSFDPTLERCAADQRSPCDGSRPSYGFRLADALAATNGDPRLADFALWRAQHGAAMLIGAQLGPTGTDSGGRQWTLIWGDPSGSAFVVSAERRAVGVPALAEEYGSFPIDPFKADDFALGPISLSAGARFYEEQVATNGADPEPNFILWGYGYNALIASCTGTYNCQTLECIQGSNVCWTPNQVFHRTGSNALSYTVVGHTTETDATTRANVWTSPHGVWPIDLEHIMFDGGNGLFVWSGDRHRDYEYTALVGPPRLESAQVESTQVAAIPTVNVGRAAITSTSVFALVLLVYFFPLLKWAGGNLLLFVPGYAKLHKSELLNNQVRDKIVQAVRADPGITPPQLQDMTGAGWSTVVYHLGVLEKNKLVSSLIDGRHKRFFPHETVNWSDRGRIAVLKNIKSRELYELVLQEPGLGPDALAQRVGITRPAIYWHTNRLEKAGLMGRDRAGLKTVFFANPAPVTPYSANDAVEVA